jgi:hypothetical protein
MNVGKAVSIPEWCICPLTRGIMREPVSLIGGRTFEKEAIATWVAGGRNRCPVDGSYIISKILQPETRLQRQIATYLDSQPILLAAERQRRGRDCAMIVKLRSDFIKDEREERRRWEDRAQKHTPRQESYHVSLCHPLLSVLLSAKRLLKLYNFSNRKWMLSQWSLNVPS